MSEKNIQTCICSEYIHIRAVPELIVWGRRMAVQFFYHAWWGLMAKNKYACWPSFYINLMGGRIYLRFTMYTFKHSLQ